MLQAENITKKFGGLVAVNDVSLNVNRGEILAIIGPNGAGKSTLFNIISGFYPLTSGKVTFAGKDVSKLPSFKIAKLGMARTFQTTNLFKHSTVLENVVVGHRMRTKSNFWDAVLRTPRFKREEQESWEKAWEVLKLVNIQKLADKPVGSISQEAKKRVAIALALATDPGLLLLDEPAAGINADETFGLAQLIRDIKNRGVTICLIEHKMQMVMSLADRIIVLNYGTKIAEGTPREISNNEKVIEAYLGGNQIA